MQEIMGAYEKPSGFEDPLVQLAIQSGLDLMGTAGSQSLIRNIGQTGSRQAPVYFKNLAEERAKPKENMIEALKVAATRFSWRYSWKRNFCLKVNLVLMKKYKKVTS
jgi:hypothetical protein